MSKKLGLDDSSFDVLEEAVNRVRKGKRQAGIPRKPGQDFGMISLVPFIIRRVLAQHPELIREAEEDAIKDIIAKHAAQQTEKPAPPDEKCESPPKAAAGR